MPNPQSGQGLPQNRASLDVSPNDPNLYLYRSFFTYEADTLANYPDGLAPGDSANLTFNIAKDSDFFWTKFGVAAFIADDGYTQSTQPIAGVNITLVNATNGRQYMNNPVPLANMSGSGQLPFILPVLTLWEALTTIQVTLQNATDNTTYSNLQLSFLGIKAFLRPGM
jgi:hypothetical protein